MGEDVTYTSKARSFAKLDHIQQYTETQKMKPPTKQIPLDSITALSSLPGLNDTMTQKI